MSTPLPFGNNNITVYSYESFSYTIPNPDSNLYTLSTTKTSGIPASYLTNNANESITFATTSNAMVPGNQSFTVFADPSGGTSVNSITIGPGRFLDPSGNSFVGSNYTFFAKEAIPPIQLVAPFNLASPVTSTPALPPGLGFSAISGSNVSIVGTPLITVPQSNYLIIGRETTSSKTVSSTISMIISNERIQTNLEGGSIVSGMQIGTPISPRTLTVKGNGTIRYTWPSFPDGIVATDNSGNVKTSGFLPSDPSYTMIITGTPTLTAANFFRNAGYSNGITQSILVERVNPLPLISNTVDLTFRFGETVLFDTASNPRLYTGVALDPSATYYRAATYFTSNVGISSIFSPDLRSDLSLAFNGVDRAYLTGTPTSAGTASYTVRAINSNAVTRDTTTTIEVLNDSVTFVTPPTPAVDVCYNFVLSRPIDLSLNGYYPTPIQFSATAASGRTIQWSAPALTGTGLSLSATSGPTVTLQGTPSNLTSLQTLAVTASATGTPATATRNVKFEIVNDVFTFASVGTISFIQNKPVTPVQFTATTLSGRRVISYSASGLPTGVTLSTTGRLSGTPTVGSPLSGSFTVSASTGFTNGSDTFSYTITPDSVLLIASEPFVELALGGPVPPVKMFGLTYSGANVSNYVFSNLSPTYGLTIDSNTGVFGGTFTTGIPPDDLLPPTVTFDINASAGTLTTPTPAVINTTNPPGYNWFILYGNGILKSQTVSNLDFNNWTSLGIPFGLSFEDVFTDYTFRPIDVSTSVIVGVTGKSGYARSTNGRDFTVNQVNPNILNVGPKRITFVPNTSTLYGVGTDSNTGDGTNAVLFRSTDDALSWQGSDVRVTSPTAFLRNANAISYKNGTILLGGGRPTLFTSSPSMAYSTDGGFVWNRVTGQMQRWVSDFSTDDSRWIVAGSDYYLPTGMHSNVVWNDTITRTLRYSDNQGATWSLVSSGDFNCIGQYVVRGNGLWIASGQEGTVGDPSLYFALRYSTDGDTWSTFTLPVPGGGSWNPLPPPPEFSPGLADLISSINYDGVNYNIVVTRYSSGVQSVVFFQHAADGSSLTTGWNEVQNNLPVYNAILPGGDRIQAMRLQGRYFLAPPTTPILSFPSQAGSGPTITSPTSTAFLLYQYVPITPIQLAGIGTDTVYFFVVAERLPPGLSFDPVTNQITGTPAELGQTSVTIYAKDSFGITTFTLGFNVILPTIQKQQSGAGAWTYLLRQYTEVNAAVNSRDTKVTPSNEYRLGEFLRPDPPSVITAVFKDCDKC